MFNRVFTIDYNRLVVILMPTFLRKEKEVGWLQALIKPIKMLYVDFSNNRRRNLYSLAHNGQVCSLRMVLNDTFDPDLRRIKIGEGSAFDRQYIYTNAEQQPKYLGKMYLRQTIDFADTGIDFRVVIPVGMADSPQLKATIDFYKLASKRYKIEYYE